MYRNKLKINISIYIVDVCILNTERIHFAIIIFPFSREQINSERGAHMWSIIHELIMNNFFQFEFQIAAYIRRMFKVQELKEDVYRVFYKWMSGDVRGGEYLKKKTNDSAAKYKKQKKGIRNLWLNKQKMDFQHIKKMVLNKDWISSNRLFIIYFCYRNHSNS